MSSRRLRIAFVHPSLGLGGAERLVVDAAYLLTQRGHDVTVFTAQLDPDAAFDEVRSGAVRVKVLGRRFPNSIAGRLKAPANIVRTAYLAMRAALAADYDVVFLDLVGHVLPLLRALTRARIVYYCHFPDVLLTPERATLSYRLYRVPLDLAESHSLNLADLLLVNSRFTAATLRETFPAVRRPVEIVSPGVDVAYYAPDLSAAPAASDEIMLLSLARYEPQKGLKLAVDALSELRSLLPPALFERVRLIQAGGLSADTPGAQATHDELMARARELGLSAQVDLRASISDTEKLALLRKARALIFTPEREHFGIVPLEAMAAGIPVVAPASGGPLETIVDGQTGFLCEPTARAFAERLALLVSDEALSLRMGQSAREHALRNLSREAFADRLERVLLACVDQGKTR